MLAGHMVKLGNQSECLVGVPLHLLYECRDSDCRCEDLQVPDFAGQFNQPFLVRNGLIVSTSKQENVSQVEQHCRFCLKQTVVLTPAK